MPVTRRGSQHGAWERKGRRENGGSYFHSSHNSFLVLGILGSQDSWVMHTSQIHGVGVSMGQGREGGREGRKEGGREGGGSILPSQYSQQLPGTWNFWLSGQLGDAHMSVTRCGSQHGREKGGGRMEDLTFTVVTAASWYLESLALRIVGWCTHVTYKAWESAWERKGRREKRVLSSQ